jgi:hypothetical protein
MQVLQYLATEAARVAQWLQRLRKDLMIPVLPVQIPLWDMGAGPPACKPLKAISAKHRSKFAAMSAVKVTVRDS